MGRQKVSFETGNNPTGRSTYPLLFILHYIQAFYHVNVYK
jgi:hypothetical protein